MNERSAKTTSSRGENRTILFALIYSMVDLANQELGDKNYLIFDDIDSELDGDRKRKLYNSHIFTKNHILSTTIQSDYQTINHLQID
jgi:recombinational DNA repair ATPase RecF